MKSNKKIMICGLMMTAVILAGSALGYGVAVLQDSTNGHFNIAKSSHELPHNVAKFTTEIPQLDFSFTSCSDCVDPYNRSELGIKQISWLDDTTLEVKAYISLNCEDKIVASDFQINDNKIILEYTVILGPETDCYCAHELIFKISNLEKKDYKFELEKLKADEIIIDEYYYKNASQDPYTINSVELEGDILTLSVSYGGGCEEHEFALIGTTILCYSVPEQTHILLSHNANNDSCEALLTEELIFDLSPFKKLFENGIRWPRTLIIWLEGWEESIVYEFEDEEQMLLLHISLDKEKYLVNESIYITATLENNLDESIVIGELGLEHMTLDFEIITPTGESMQYIGPGIDFTDSITLDPKETIQVTYNLLEKVVFGYEFEYDYIICDFQTEGLYSVGGTYTSFCTNEDAVEMTVTSNIENFIIIGDS